MKALTLDEIKNCRNFDARADYSFVYVYKDDLPRIVAMVVGDKLHLTKHAKLFHPEGEYVCVSHRIDPMYYSSKLINPEVNLVKRELSVFNWFVFWIVKWKAYRLLRIVAPELAKTWRQRQDTSIYSPVSRFSMDMPVTQVKLYQMISAIVYFSMFTELPAAQMRIPDIKDNALYWSHLDRFFEHYPLLRRYRNNVENHVGDNPAEYLVKVFKISEDGVWQFDVGTLCGNLEGLNNVQ